MAASRQAGAQLLVVVQLAVQHDLRRAVFTGDRLLPAGDVDDAQPPHADADAVGDERPVVVGAPVHDGIRHPPDDRGDVLSRETAIDDPSYATHIVL